MEENKGSAFKDGEYREFCWQWCLVMIMLNPKKSNPNREYAKRLYYERENKNERSNQVLQRF